MSAKLRKRFLVSLLVLVIGVLSAESIARYYLGLGDPPLVVADPEMAYVFAPSREYKRFGNRIRYNAFSMRSDDFPAHKSSKEEKRVLFLGNSIINGGALTDQSRIATTLLQDHLRSGLERLVWVGNASAGGWGPESEWAYAKRYGFFDADVIVIVLTDGDYHNTRRYLAGTDPNFPTMKPVLALQEAFTRYLPQYVTLPKFGEDGYRKEAVFRREDEEQGTLALNQLVLAAKATGAQVFLVQHVKRDNPDRRSLLILQDIAHRHGASFVSLEPAFRAAQQQGRSVYRDSIHPNDDGQEIIASTLFPLLETTLKQGSPPQNGLIHQ